MRSTAVCAIVLGLASLAQAKDPKPYQTGQLMQMDSVPCTDAQSRPLCREYTLESENVVYHIRPRNQKHSVLPVGERAQFRLQKDTILLRTEEVDSKEQPYVVVSISPRSDSDTAEVSVRLNHLQ